MSAIGDVAGTLTLKLANAGGANDAVTLNLTNLVTTGANVNGVNIAGLALGGSATAGQIETLNIVSGPRVAGNGTYNTVTEVASGAGPNYADANTVKITGAAGITFTTGSGQHSQTIDASAQTGGVMIVNTAAPAAASTYSIIGSAVNDTITSTGNTSSIYGGSGGDFITVGGGLVQTIIYKTASDSQLDLTGTTGGGGNVGASGTGGNVNTSGMDIVGGFVSGTDKIDISSFGFAGSTRGIVDQGNAGSDSQFRQILGRADLFSDGIATRALAQIHGTAGMGSGVAGDFLVIDINGDGRYTAGIDMVIKFVGLASLAFTDFNA